MAFPWSGLLFVLDTVKGIEKKEVPPRIFGMKNAPYIIHRKNGWLIIKGLYLTFMIYMNVSLIANLFC